MISTQEYKSAVNYLKDMAGKAGIKIDEPYPNPHLSTVSVVVKDKGDAQKLVSTIHGTGASARYDKIDALVDDVRIVKDTVVLDLEEQPTKKLSSSNAYRIDRTPGNQMAAEDLKPRILTHLEKYKKATTDGLYRELNCGDIPLYLALHDLVNEKKIKGISPYDETAESGSKEYQYIPSGSENPAMPSKLASLLDDIANRLEAKGLLKEAYQVDVVANTIETQSPSVKTSAIDRQIQEIKEKLQSMIKHETGGKTDLTPMIWGKIEPKLKEVARCSINIGFGSYFNSSAISNYKELREEALEGIEKIIDKIVPLKVNGQPTSFAEDFGEIFNDLMELGESIGEDNREDEDASIP